jgi:hypothetical protein
MLHELQAVTPSPAAVLCLPHATSCNWRLLTCMSKAGFTLLLGLAWAMWAGHILG